MGNPFPTPLDTPHGQELPFPPFFTHPMGRNSLSHPSSHTPWARTPFPTHRPGALSFKIRTFYFIGCLTITKTISHKPIFNTEGEYHVSKFEIEPTTYNRMRYQSRADKCIFHLRPRRHTSRPFHPPTAESRATPGGRPGAIQSRTDDPTPNRTRCRESEPFRRRIRNPSAENQSHPTAPYAATPNITAVCRSPTHSSQW